MANMPSRAGEDSTGFARPADIRRSAAARLASAIRSGAYQLGLQGSGLVVVALVLALGGWFGRVQANKILLVALSVAFLVLAGVAVVLYRQHRAWRATVRAFESMRARAQDFFESAADAIVSFDETGRILLFNPAAEATFRWPRAAVLGEPFDMLFPERVREVHRTYVAEFATTGALPRRTAGFGASTGLRANGEEFPIDASISQHVEDGHKLLTVILRDVGARVRSETLLSRSEARLRAILDSAMDAIVTIDDRQKIVLFNSAAEKMFLCPRDQAVGAPLDWFMPQRYRDNHAANVEAFGATRVTTRRMAGARVITGLRRNGEEFPIDASISQLVEGEQKFYTVILRDVGDLTRALESLAQSKDELRELASAAVSAREQEQARIARELHDELAQSMSTLKMDVALIRARAFGADAGLQKRLDRMDEQIDSTIAAMRRIAADLRPLALDDLGLCAALQSLVAGFEHTSGVRCRLDMPERLELPSAHASAVFRTVQEALTNVRKHAKASMVDVSLVVDDDGAHLMVRDDGVGFGQDAPRDPRSFGHLGLRERAYLLGGEARITSSPGNGTRIEVSLPVRVAEAAT